MPKLTTRRQITTGNMLQVRNPAELELYSLVQVDSLRKRRLLPVRAALVAGAVLSGNSNSDERLPFGNRLVQAWRDSGYISDAFFRGVVTEKTDGGFILDFVHFDFHPHQPLENSPVIPDVRSQSILERSRDHVHFRYEDIGMVAIQPNVPGSGNYHTGDDVGRYSVATVHQMFEPLPVIREPHDA